MTSLKWIVVSLVVTSVFVAPVTATTTHQSSFSKTAIPQGSVSTTTVSKTTTTGLSGSNSLTAAWTNTTPTINGQINPSEWTNANKYTLSFKNYDGSKTHKSTVYLMHDNQFLYVAIDSGFADGWDNHAVLFFDGNNDGRTAANTTSPYRDFKVGEKAPGGWSGYHHVSLLGTNQTSATFPPSSLSRASSTSGGSVTYEFRVPLNALGVTTGDTMGVQLRTHTPYHGLNQRYYWAHNPKSGNSVANWANLSLARKTTPLGTITGTIVNKNGTTVTNSTDYQVVDPTTGNVLANGSTTSGHYRVTTPPGNYRIEVSSLGYQNGSTTVSVQSGATTQADVVLTSSMPTPLNETTVFAAHSQNASPGSTVKIPIKLHSPPASIGAYSFNASVSNQSVATISSVKLHGSPGVSSNSTTKGHAHVSAALASIKKSTNVTLATLTVKTHSVGQTQLRITNPTIALENGTTISLAGVRNTTLTVSNNAGGPVVVGSNHAKTYHGSSKYLDVNGDGKLTISDVQAFFAHRNQLNGNTKFDYNGNGKVDIGDVQKLFHEVMS